MSAQVGTGVTLITVDGRLQISAIKPEGSAAASARICVGDYLVAINGVRLNFEAHAKELILGAYGTSLEVEVSRSEQSRTVTLWRGGTDAQMNGEAAEKAKAAAEASATATHLRLSSGFNKHLDSLSGPADKFFTKVAVISSICATLDDVVHNMQHPAPIEITLAEYNPKWTQDFDREAKRLARDGYKKGFKHIGSTSIKGATANPYIDMLYLGEYCSFEQSGYREYGRCVNTSDTHRVAGLVDSRGDQRYFYKTSQEPSTCKGYFLYFRCSSGSVSLTSFAKLLGSDAILQQYNRAKHRILDDHPRISFVDYTMLKTAFIMTVNCQSAKDDCNINGRFFEEPLTGPLYELIHFITCAAQNDVPQKNSNSLQFEPNQVFQIGEHIRSGRHYRQKFTPLGLALILAIEPRLSTLWDRFSPSDFNHLDHENPHSSAFMELPLALSPSGEERSQRLFRYIDVIRLLIQHGCTSASFEFCTDWTCPTIHAANAGGANFGGIIPVKVDDDTRTIRLPQLCNFGPSVQFFDLFNVNKMLAAFPADFFIANPYYLGLKDKCSKTLLHFAATRGIVAAIDMLVAARADILAEDKNGCTPMECAANEGHFPALKAFLSAGAVENNRTSQIIINRAVSEGFVDDLKYLLQAGVGLQTFGMTLCIDGTFFNANKANWWASVEKCVNVLLLSRPNYITSFSTFQIKNLKDRVSPSAIVSLVNRLPPNFQPSCLHFSRVDVDDAVFERCCGHFRSLTELVVSGSSHLSNIPSAISQLRCLKQLVLSECSALSSFPDEILILEKSLTTITANNCGNLTFPPNAVVKNGSSSIYSFIKDAMGQKPLNRVKVLFLGNGRSGKTSLLNTLVNQPLEDDNHGPDSTPGVSVDALEKELKPSFLESFNRPEMTYWDFAGQLQYSAAHDCFFSNRQAVYVIVFNVMEDRESQINQVSFWLRTVAVRVSEYVRFLIVGTKIDLIKGEQSVVKKRLEGVAADMRSVLLNCCGLSVSEHSKVIFVTSIGAHPSYQQLRRQFEAELHKFCSSIFKCDPSLLRKLRFPKLYIETMEKISKLSASYSGLPLLHLESIDPLDSSKSFLRNSHKNAQLMTCFSVLHDVGVIILYEIQDHAGHKSPCICWKPQLLPDIMALFVDPIRSDNFQRGCALRADLHRVLKDYLDTKPSWYQPERQQNPSLQSSRYADSLFDVLVNLRVFVPIERRALESEAHVPISESQMQFMVPCALKGRPSFWREVFGTQTYATSYLRGLRLQCFDPMITVAAFVRAMTALCSNPIHMWGCAFLFELRNGCCIFVRLAENRSFVDIVTFGSDLSQLNAELVDDACRQVAAFLSCNICSCRWLCPYCCTSDMFVRSGAAHVFFNEQFSQNSDVCGVQQHSNLGGVAVATDSPQALHDCSDPSSALSFLSHEAPARIGVSSGGIRGKGRLLSCCRRHEVYESGVLSGQYVGNVGCNDMPVLYPGSRHNSLPWVTIVCSGLAQHETGGEVLPSSFFCLTQQLDVGFVISRDSVEKINDAICTGLKSIIIKEKSEPLKLEFCNGESIGGNVIDFIISCPKSVVIKSCCKPEKGFVTTNGAHGLHENDEVLLSVRFDEGIPVDGVRCKVSEVISDTQLVFQRLEPSVKPKPLPLAPDVTIMPFSPSFTASDNVLVVYKQQPGRKQKIDLFPGISNLLRIIRLVPSDCISSAELSECWREVEDNWAIVLGSEFQNYEITGITLFHCQAGEQAFLNEVSRLKKIAKHRSPPDFSCVMDEIDVDKRNRSALQKQVMRHFTDFSQKFSLLPVEESKDINTCVSWWGNKSPAAYYGIAQNGFWNMPSHLKLDAGYFGDGFYLTRYPRYSDYYINGSLSKRNVDHGSILMCYSALGRPYPVTQDPEPHARFSCCGKCCGEACHFTSTDGIDSHDSHYVTVKMHPKEKNYYPCPLRQEPDFDEIVVFNPKRILPTAYVTFQRRFKTLLWLDDCPDSPENVRIRSKIPGAAWFDQLVGDEQLAVKLQLLRTLSGGVKLIGATGPHADTVNGDYEQQSGMLCCGEPVFCKKDETSWIEYDSARLAWQVKDFAHRGDGSWALASVTQDRRFTDASFENFKYNPWRVVTSHLESNRVSFKLNSAALDAQPIALEDQIDVTLFKSVAAMTAFLSDVKQSRFAKYHSSIFRIVSNRRLFFGYVSVDSCDAKEFMCFGCISSLLSVGDALMFEEGPSETYNPLFGGVQAGVKYYLASCRSSRTGELFSISMEPGGSPLNLKPHPREENNIMRACIPNHSLLHFFETNAVWKQAFPATCLFHGGSADPNVAFFQKQRPNFFGTNDELLCEQFATFQRLDELLYRS